MGYLIGFSLLSIFFFTLFIVISRLLYKRRMNIKYSLRNMFPFETLYKTQFNEGVYSHIFLWLSLLAMVSFFITFDMSFNDTTTILIMVGGILSALIIGALFYTPLMRLKTHVILASLLFSSLFFETAMILISAWRSNQENMTWQTITGIIFSGFLLLVIFALAMNPRLTLKLKAVEVKKEDGTIEYQRPKGIALAFSEWVLIIVYLVSILDIVLYKLVVNG